MYSQRPKRDAKKQSAASQNLMGILIIVMMTIMLLTSLPSASKPQILAGPTTSAPHYPLGINPAVKYSLLEKGGTISEGTFFYVAGSDGWGESYFFGRDARGELGLVKPGFDVVLSKVKEMPSARPSIWTDAKVLPAFTMIPVSDGQEMQLNIVPLSGHYIWLQQK